jgi:hypothetical protein
MQGVLFLWAALPAELDAHAALQTRGSPGEARSLLAPSLTDASRRNEVPERPRASPRARRRSCTRSADEPWPPAPASDRYRHTGGSSLCV